MSRRTKTLLMEAREWCEQVWGRQSKLARALGVRPEMVSRWFREAQKAKPAKQPTAEQILAIQEFLAEQRQK